MGISRKRATVALCLALPLAFSGACESFTINLTFITPKTASSNETQNSDLPAGARVVVNNDNGSTRVEVDPNATRATIEIERIAYGGTQDEVDALLADIVVTITEPTGADNTLRIDAPKPAAATGVESDFEFSLVDDELNVTGILRARFVATVRLRITLPQGHGVDVTQVNGAIRAENLDTAGTLDTERGSIRVLDATGDVTARTENGSVVVRDHRASLDVETDRGSVSLEVQSLAAGQQIVVRTDRGAIECRLPHDIDAELQADADRGIVDFDLTDFDSVSNAIATFDSVEATLNGGGPTITLDTNHGVIDIDGN